MALWGFPVVLKVNTQLKLENEGGINQGMVMKGNQGREAGRAALLRLP